jgi:hypothetical protein
MNNNFEEKHVGSLFFKCHDYKLITVGGDDFNKKS